MNAILERVAQKRGRHLSRRRRPPASRQDPRRLPLSTARVPTIRTTSSRTSTAASCARCACSARGRTSPISRRPTRSTRSSPRTAARSSSTTCRTSARRSACATTCTSGISAGSTSTRATRRAKRLFSFGFALSPWQTVHYDEIPVDRQVRGRRVRSAERGGRRRRRPPTWRLRDDDAFWAARRVAAFTDELIRAAVHTGQFSDPTAEKYLGDVLIKRRDKILRDLSDRREPDRRRRARRERPADVRERRRRGRRGDGAGRRIARRGFASTTRPARRSRSSTRRARRRRSSAAGLPTAPGSFVAVDISADSAAHPTWQQPVRTLLPPTARGLEAGRARADAGRPRSAGEEETVSSNPSVVIRAGGACPRPHSSHSSRDQWPGGRRPPSSSPMTTPWRPIWTSPSRSSTRRDSRHVLPDGKFPQERSSAGARRPLPGTSSRTTR